MARPLQCPVCGSFVLSEVERQSLLREAKNAELADAFAYRCENGHVVLTCAEPFSYDSADRPTPVRKNTELLIYNARKLIRGTRRLLEDSRKLLRRN